MYIQFKLSRAQIAHWNKNVDVRRARSYEWNLLQPKSIAELRLNGLVRHLLDLRQSLRERDERARLHFERQFIGKRLLADVIEAVTEVGALVWVVLQIIGQQQPIGQFVYVQQLVSRAIGSANAFVAQLSTIDEDLANLYDYQKFMALPIRQGGDTPIIKSPQRIAFRKVTFRYPNAQTDVLKNITFDIKQGQHIAIVGENGAGKSTLIRLLTGLYAPTSGTILIDTIPLQHTNIHTWHARLSVLQQDFEHYSFANIKDNVYFGDVSTPPNSARIAEALQKAEAKNFVQKLPQKLATYPSPWMEDDEGNKGMALSGGQWQRLALARSFYRNSPIIILDEPTSAIDALAEMRIFKRLFAKKNRKTVITISHRLSTIEKADQIYLLQNGQITESGTHNELVAKKGDYYRMFKSQLKEIS